MLPLEKTVDCACDPRLSRPVWSHNNWAETRVNACLRCGKITGSVAMGDEPRGAGEPGGANFVVPVPTAWIDWLDAWPRLLTLGDTSDDPVWCPADRRFETVDELAAATAELARETAEMNAGARLRRLGRPASPPPTEPSGSKWEREFRAFAIVWLALQLSPEADPVDLIARAAPHNPASYVAIDLLLRRADLLSILDSVFAGTDGDAWGAAIAVIRWQRPPQRAVVDSLLNGLLRLPLTPFDGWDGHVQERGRFDQALDALARARVPLDWIDAPLKAIQDRVGKRDWDLTGRVSKFRRGTTAGG